MPGPLQTLRELGRGIADGLMRLGLLVFGVLAALVAVVTGLALAVGLMLWSLLRGRRPSPSKVFVVRPRAARQVPPAEVIDVQARELQPGERTPQR